MSSECRFTDCAAVGRYVSLHFRFCGAGAVSLWTPRRHTAGNNPDKLAWVDVCTLLSDIPRTTVSERIAASVAHWKGCAPLRHCSSCTSCGECDRPIDVGIQPVVPKKHHVQCLWCALHDFLEWAKDADDVVKRFVDMVRVYLVATRWIMAFRFPKVNDLHSCRGWRLSMSSVTFR